MSLGEAKSCGWIQTSKPKQCSPKNPHLSPHHSLTVSSEPESGLLTSKPEKDTNSPHSAMEFPS